MREDELAIIGSVQRADPRVEDHHGVDPGVDLRHEVVADDVRQRLTEAVPGGGGAVHQQLGVGEAGRVAALDRVRGEGERRAGETDERDAAGQGPLDLANRVEHIAERFARLEPPDAREVGFAAQRRFDGRAFAADEIERDAERRERKEEIGKQDRRIHFDPADRLKRDFGGEIGRSTDIEQRIALAQAPILAHVAARLTHEPDWRCVNRLPSAGFEKSAARIRQWVTLSRLRASPTRSSSHKGLNRSSAPSSRSSVEMESSRK